MNFVITAPATDRSLLTPAEARSAIDDTTADVTALIARVSASIAAACRVPRTGAAPPTLRLETLTATYRLKAPLSSLILPRKPVVEILSVAENDAVLSADAYEVDASAGMLMRLASGAEVCWPCGHIAVAFRAGWSTVPDDLKELACKLARTFWFERQRQPGLRSMEIPGVIAESYQDKDADNPNIPFEVMQGLHEGGYVYPVV